MPDTALEPRGATSVRFAARLQDASPDLTLLDASGSEAAQISGEASVSSPTELRFRWKGAANAFTFCGIANSIGQGPPIDGFNTQPANWVRLWDTAWLQVTSPSPPS